MSVFARHYDTSSGAINQVFQKPGEDLQAAMARTAHEINEQSASEKRAQRGIVDLVEINGVWMTYEDASRAA